MEPWGFLCAVEKIKRAGIKYCLRCVSKKAIIIISIEMEPIRGGIMKKERTTEEQKRAEKTAKCFLIVAGIILLLIILMPGDRKKEADPASEPPTAAEKRSAAKPDKSPAEEKEDADKTDAIKAALQPLLDETIGKTADDYYTIDVSEKLVSINVS